MGNGGAGQGGRVRNLGDVEPLSPVESQEDALALFVAQGGKGFRDVLPDLRDFSCISDLHENEFKFLIMFVKKKDS